MRRIATIDARVGAFARVWGYSVFIAGTGGLGIASALTAAAPPTLFPAAPDSAGVAIAGGMVATAAVLSLTAAKPQAARGFIAGSWIVAFVLAMLAAWGSANTPAWVPVVEAALLAASASIAVVGARRDAFAWLPLGAAAMLLLFAWIHWHYSDAIAALMPAVLPASEVIPFVTASILAIGAVAALPPITRAVSLTAIAALFGSWLPIVHAPRLLNNPADMAEWEFALMAVCLSGALLVIAGGGVGMHDRRTPRHRARRETLSALLSVRDGARAIDFYQKAFGVEPIFRVDDDHGAVVARLAVGEIEFWVADESPPDQNFSPETLGGGTVRMILTVPDPDATFDRAVSAGAEVVWPMADRYGWRLGRVADPLGHHWEIGRPDEVSGAIAVAADGPPCRHQDSETQTGR